MATEVNITDEELEGLMAELEQEANKCVEAIQAEQAQQAQQAAEVPTEPAAAPIAAAQPEPEPIPVAPSEPPAPVTQEDFVAEVPEPTNPAVERNEPAIENAVPVAEEVPPWEEAPVVDPVPPQPEQPEQPEQAERRVKPGESYEPFGRPSVGKSMAPGGLDHYIDAEQFRIDTRVTEATLDQCMIEQNGLRAFYGAQAAYAEAQAGRLKAKFEVVEATLYDHHRKALAASGEKTTEKMVENAVKMDPRWLKAKNLVIEAETIAAINKGLVESIKDRRDMIIQLGADRRDEYKGGARILAAQNERENLVSRAAQAGRRAA